MSIPANITSELASLQAQVAAAGSLTKAPRASVTALQLNAAALVSDVQGALTAASTLDSFAAPVSAPDIIAGVQALVSAAEDQDALSLMRGLVGRVASNLSQLP